MFNTYIHTYMRERVGRDRSGEGIGWRGGRGGEGGMEEIGRGKERRE